jgi:hypothetical protein
MAFSTSMLCNERDMHTSLKVQKLFFKCCCKACVTEQVSKLSPLSTNEDARCDRKTLQKEIDMCQFQVCILCVQSLNISPHCPQSVPEIISE